MLKLLNKKILFILVIFFAVLGLVSCTKSDSKKLDEALNQTLIKYSNSEKSNQVKSNLKLETSFGDVVLTWKSDKPSVISASGVVTRQESDVDVKLTVLAVYKTYQQSKTFDLKVLKLEVAPKPKTQFDVVFNYNDEITQNKVLKVDENTKVLKPSNPSRVGYTFVQWQLNGEEFDFETLVTAKIELIAQWSKNVDAINTAVLASDDTQVEIEGIISYTDSYGAYLSDETGSIYLHKGTNFSIGDKVRVSGKKLSYNTTSQLRIDTETPNFTIISNNNELPSGINFDKLSKLTNTTNGFIVNINNLFIKNKDGQKLTVSDLENQLVLNFENEAIGEISKYNVEDKINLVSAFAMFKNNVSFLVVNKASQVVKQEKTATDKINQAISKLVLPEVIEENKKIELLQVVDGINVVWTTSNSSIITITGDVVLPSLETQVKLTASLTHDNITIEKEFLVLAKPYTGFVAKTDFIDFEDQMWGPQSTDYKSGKRFGVEPKTLSTNQGAITVSGSAIISGNRTFQMRQYTGDSQVAYLTLDYDVNNLSKIEFKAMFGKYQKSTHTKLYVSVSSDKGTTWVSEKEYAISAKGLKQTIVYNVEESLQSQKLRFKIATLNQGGDISSLGKVLLSIDDLSFTYKKDLNEKQEFNVVFNYDDNTTASSQVKVLEGNKVSKPENPQREGYTFKHWYLSTDESKLEFNFETLISSSIELKALWEIKTYVVQFTTGVDSIVIENQTITHGQTVQEVVVSKRGGYRFVEWQLDGAKFDFATPVVKELNLVAKWVEVNTVYFEVNGGEEIKPIVEDLNVTVTLPDGVKQGYRFDGWFLEDEFKVQVTKQYVVDATVTLYAKFTKVVNVTLNYNDTTTENKTTQIVENTKYLKPTDPQREGFEFIHWSLSTDSSNAAYDFEQNVVKDIELVAQWKQLKVSVTVNFNGATIESNSEVVIEIDSNNTIKNELTAQTSTLQLQGSRLAGWTYVLNSDEIINLDTEKFLENKTIYARWIEQKTITYVVQDGDAIASHTGDINSLVTLPVAVKANEVFVGWFTSSLLDVEVQLDQDSKYVLVDNVEMHAKFRPIQQFTVTFDLNNGTTVENTDPKTVNENTTITLFDLTRSNDRFEGWYDNNQFTGNKLDKQYVVTKTITLYARFTKVFTVTFNYNDTVTENKEVLVDENSQVQLQPNPTREGYTFVFWYLDGDDSKQYDVATPVTQNITILAKWEVVKRSVTFNTTVEGNTTTQVVEVDNNTKVAQQTPQTIQNYAFKHWYLETDENKQAFDFETLITQNITLNALYEITAIPVGTHTIAQVKDLVDDTKITVYGYVYHSFSRNIAIMDQTGGISIYHNNKLGHDLQVVGNILKIESTKTSYGTLNQIEGEKATVTLLGNNVSLKPQALEIQSLALTEKDPFNVYNISNVFARSVASGALTIADASGNEIKLTSDDSTVKAHILGLAANTKLSLSNIYYYWANANYHVLRATSINDVALAALTALEKIDKDHIEINIPTIIEQAQTLTLPQSGSEGSTITWTSNTPATISDAGVVVLPQSGSVMVVLTAQFQLGSEQKSFTYQVEVKAYTGLIEKVYSEDFENSANFKAGTLYKTKMTVGPADRQWILNTGTPSKTSAINGTSLQARAYSTTPVSIETAFDIPNARKIELDYKLKMAGIEFYISTDSGQTWIKITSHTLVNGKLSYDVESQYQSGNLRFKVQTSNTKKKSQLIIDNVKITYRDAA